MNDNEIVIKARTYYNLDIPDNIRRWVRTHLDENYFEKIYLTKGANEIYLNDENKYVFAMQWYGPMTHIKGQNKKGNRHWDHVEREIILDAVIELQKVYDEYLENQETEEPPAKRQKSLEILKARDLISNKY